MELDYTREETKQALILDVSLGMEAGKLVAQGAHQSVANVLKDGRIQEVDGQRCLVIPLDQDLEDWVAGRFKKIALAAKDGATVQSIYDKAIAMGLRATLITDAGLTHFDGVPTITGVGIGPHTPDKMKSLTGNLPLLRNKHLTPPEAK